eukprot:34527-Heterocapsa_arctica.AAC.1
MIGAPRGMAVMAVRVAMLAAQVAHEVVFQWAFARSGSTAGAGHQCCPAKGHAAVGCLLRSVAILCPAWQGWLASGVMRAAVGGRPLCAMPRGSPGVMRVRVAPAC